MYPKTLPGLISCYVARIPFYQHRFAGDLLFTAVFFAIPVLLKLPEGTGQKAAV